MTLLGAGGLTEKDEMLNGNHTTVMENKMRWNMSREDRDRAVDILSQEYPKAFFSDPRKRVPLKEGIEDEIKTSLKANGDNNLAFYDIDEAVTWYQNHVGYIRSCTTAGAIRIDLEGNAVAKITESEAAIASQEAVAIYEDMAVRKRLGFQPPQPQPATTAVREVKALSVDTSLSTVELLAKVQEQSGAVKVVLEGISDSQFAMLMRPALRLMIDELNTVMVRLDKGEV